MIEKLEHSHIASVYAVNIENNNFFVWKKNFQNTVLKLFWQFLKNFHIEFPNDSEITFMCTNLREKIIQRYVIKCVW